jgi:lysophospholipase L1-like esterase
MNKKTILFFGDSLTFGLDAQSDDRFDYEKRWTSIVEKEFSNTHRCVVEGQCGRTISDDDVTEGRNGLKAFIQSTYSHVYLDYIFIMLGTNDLKEKFRVSEKEMADKFKLYKEVLNKFESSWTKKTAKVILIAPPKIDERHVPKKWGFKNSQNISNNLSTEYQNISESLSWDFLDASQVKVDPIYGVHLNIEGNLKVSELIISYLSEKEKAVL